MSSYSRNRPDRWKPIKILGLFVLLAIVAASVYVYNHGPGKDRISGDVDMYGRQMH